jgi:hypothetical protein
MQMLVSRTGSPSRHSAVGLRAMNTATDCCVISALAVSLIGRVVWRELGCRVGVTRLLAHGQDAPTRLGAIKTSRRPVRADLTAATIRRKGEEDSQVSWIGR